MKKLEKQRQHEADIREEMEAKKRMAAEEEALRKKRKIEQMKAHRGGGGGGLLQPEHSNQQKNSKKIYQHLEKLLADTNDSPQIKCVELRDVKVWSIVTSLLYLYGRTPVESVGTLWCRAESGASQSLMFQHVWGGKGQ